MCLRYTHPCDIQNSELERRQALLECRSVVSRLRIGLQYVMEARRVLAAMAAVQGLGDDKEGVVGLVGVQ